ncbi:hypothetical protein ACFQAT_15550 [Undibacterium arcticum]|uniref:hypothetical protein n=1 Tax=Undibacterium arcticum TaxID=1762892 RepID=UPI0036204B7C
MAGLHNTYGIAARNFTAYPEMPDAKALVDYGVRMEELGLIRFGSGITSSWACSRISQSSIR